VLLKKQATHYRKTINTVTITLQKRIMMGTNYETAQLTLISLDNRSHALWTHAPALHTQQVHA